MLLLFAVGLSSTASGDSPVLLDSTGPLPGQVLDGDTLGQDSCCQADHAALCVQWRHFQDPESHIERYSMYAHCSRCVV